MHSSKKRSVRTTSTKNWHQDRVMCPIWAITLFFFKYPQPAVDIQGIPTPQPPFFSFSFSPFSPHFRTTFHSPSFLLLVPLFTPSLLFAPSGMLAYHVSMLVHLGHISLPGLVRMQYRDLKPCISVHIITCICPCMHHLKQSLLTYEIWRTPNLVPNISSLKDCAQSC